MTDRQYVLTVRNFFFYHFYPKFITPLDFGFMMDWYEMSISLDIIWQSMKEVRTRRKVKSFWNLDYTVRKNFKVFLQLKVGSHEPEPIPASPEPETESHDDYLEEMTAFQEDELLERFRDDHELNIKTKIFMKSLAPSFRTPEIKKLYRLNYIFHRLRLRRRANVYKNQNKGGHMKPKKITLKKVTVSNLRGYEMNDIVAGGVIVTNYESQYGDFVCPGTWCGQCTGLKGSACSWDGWYCNDPTPEE